MEILNLCVILSNLLTSLKRFPILSAVSCRNLYKVEAIIDVRQKRYFHYCDSLKLVSFDCFPFLFVLTCGSGGKKCNVNNVAKKKSIFISRISHSVCLALCLGAESAEP